MSFGDVTEIELERLQLEEQSQHGDSSALLSVDRDWKIEQDLHWARPGAWQLSLSDGSARSCSMPDGSWSAGSG